MTLKALYKLNKTKQAKQNKKTRRKTKGEWGLSGDECYFKQVGFELVFEGS